MKDTLELKHLAPYLPYGLKIYIDTWKCEREVCQLRENSIVTKKYGNHLNLERIKPILRPLSDIEKEIEITGHSSGGWKICILDHLLGLLPIEDEFESIHKKQMVLTYPYESIQILLEYHFDVFGLIDKGLAVDINTVKTEL